MGHVGVGGTARQVLQLQDVTVEDVGVDAEAGLEIDNSRISAL
jgi:hypothetical protein